VWKKSPPWKLRRDPGRPTWKFRPRKYIKMRGHPEPAEIRFWRFVQKFDSGCWIWTGCKVGRSEDRRYGRFNIGNSIIVLAHRFSYELEYGSLLPEIELHHTCPNKLCVNPAHLIPLTTSEHHKIEPRMAKRKFCKRGHLKSENAISGRRCRICIAWNYATSRRRSLRVKLNTPYTPRSTHGGKPIPLPTHSSK
jgi:hypothetical protein